MCSEVVSSESETRRLYLPAESPPGYEAASPPTGRTRTWVGNRKKKTIMLALFTNVPAVPPAGRENS